jgi:hypothetical protein
MEGARKQERGVGGLSPRAAAWLAWSLCAFSLALTALSLLLLALNLSHPDVHVYDYWLENTILPLSFSIIGAVIASRLPANPLGWLFCAAASIAAVAHFSAEYAIYALLARPGSLPADEGLAWLSYWVLPLAFGCVVLSLLLFPNGRSPSIRWRWLAWLTVLVTIVGAIWVALSPGVIANLGSIRNPLGIEGSTRWLQAGPDHHVRSLVRCGGLDFGVATAPGEGSRTLADQMACLYRGGGDRRQSPL